MPKKLVPVGKCLTFRGLVEDASGGRPKQGFYVAVGKVPLGKGFLVKLPAAVVHLKVSAVGVLLALPYLA